MSNAEEQNKKNLKAARLNDKHKNPPNQASQTGPSGKKTKKSRSVGSIISKILLLPTAVLPNDALIIIPFTLAVGKDAADIIVPVVANTPSAILNLIPVVGQLLSVVVAAYFWAASISITFSINLCLGATNLMVSNFIGASGRLKKRLIIILVGVVTEMFIGVSFVPGATATVIIIYAMTLWERVSNKE
jgi:hypothetical protein